MVAAPQIHSMVGETAAAPGTGNITLGGALSGFLAFDDAQGLGTGSLSNIPVLCKIELASDATSWELARCLYTKSGATKTLVRSDVRRSTNAGGSVNFTGTVNVYIVADGHAMGPEAASRSYALTAGTSTAYTATFAPAIAELIDGMVVEVEWDETCGAAPTLNVNGTGAKNIRGARSGTMQNVPEGTLRAGCRDRLSYRASTDTWNIVGSHTCAGTHTPTLTAVANVDAVTAGNMRWLYVDGIVTLAGRISIDATAAGGTLTTVRGTLPVPTTMNTNAQCAGTSQSTAFNEPGRIAGDTANQQFSLSFLSQGTTDRDHFLHMTYQVI